MTRAKTLPERDVNVLDGAACVAGPDNRQRAANRYRQCADGHEGCRVNTYRWQGKKQPTGHHHQ
ncbi:hypothetical protein ACLBOM_35810 [Escherichia coli]